MTASGNAQRGLDVPLEAHSCRPRSMAGMTGSGRTEPCPTSSARLVAVMFTFWAKKIA
ncbi:hypothetical protein GOC00_30565 [Sinorhizobium meliloti]|nr:hypothetical protein [Sinorhizobium meliloti]MDX0079484.1 hypothetical protein [Sinorhizobium meliloti]